MTMLDVVEWIRDNVEDYIKKFAKEYPISRHPTL